MTRIYVTSVLVGLAAVLIGAVIVFGAELAFVWVSVQREMATSTTGGLGAVAVAVPDYYYPFGALVVFAIAFWWSLRRQRDRRRALGSRP